MEHWVELLALLLAIWATWLSIPRPPSLDWERLFKTSLATVIRGEVESADGDARAWEERLRREVPYHPAGRDLERWLETPEPDAIRNPALDGERGLVTALGLLPDAVSRYRYAMGGDARGLDALMGDPAWLGEPYDPARIIGSEGSWDAIAAWSPHVVEGLMRRLSHVIFLGVGDRRWAQLCPVPGVRVVSVPDGDPSAIESEMEGALESPSDRIIIGLTDGCSDGVLELMSSQASVRDRVLGVVSFGAVLRSDWAEESFTHRGMEPELQRTIPFISMIDVDAEAPLARSWDAQRFWEPPVPEGGRRSIEAIDLGPVPLNTLSDAVLARALWTTLAFRLTQGS